MAIPIITRAEARAQGLPRYFTGKPCIRGHLSERHTGNACCVACLKVHSKNWMQQNPEKNKAKNARWRKANPEKEESRKARWRTANPERAKAHIERCRNSDIENWRARDRLRSSFRRAQMCGDNGTHTTADLAEILRAQGNRCAYCKVDLKQIKKQVDHIVPLVRGGSNGRSNLQYLCQPCNNTKSAKDPVDFAQSIGLLL